MSLTTADWSGLTEDVVHRQQRAGMAPADVGLYLGGYLAPFGLRRPTAVHTGRDGGAWILEGLARWWERPGPPAVPQDELAREEMGRLNFILKETIGAAARRGELHLLTHKQGRDRQALLYRCGLGALA